MNQYQNKIVIIGILLIALVALFPPWYIPAGDSQGLLMGFHLLFKAPTANNDPDNIGGRVNFDILKCELLLIIALMTAAFIYFKDRQNNQ